MQDIIVHIDNEQQMDVFARQLARHYVGGEVLFLDGDLGVGKTTFTRYFTQALGGSDVVSSPTFTIEQQYACGEGLLVHHYDLYRMSDDVSFFAQEFLENCDDDKSIHIVEWGEALKAHIPRYTCIRLERQQASDEARVLTVSIVDNAGDE